MKRFAGSLVVALVCILVLFSLVFAKNVSQLLGGFVVDIEQSVPVLADVVVVDKDGEEIKATVPLTVGVKMQVLIDGAQATVLDSEDPAVSVEKKDPPAATVSDGEGVIEKIDVPYIYSAQDGLKIVGISGKHGMFGDEIEIEIENVGDAILKRSSAVVSAYDSNNKLLFVSPLNTSGDAIAPGDKTAIKASLFTLDTMNNEDFEISNLYIQVTGEFQKDE